MRSESFGHGFAHGRGHEQIDRERLAFLSKPPAPPPPELIAPTRCRVLRPFFFAGNRVEVGELVVLPKHDAHSLAAIRKVELAP